MHDVRMTFTVRRFGEAYLQAIDRADELLAAFPNLVVDPQARRRRRARALLTTALDSVEAGERQGAARCLREAARLYPRIVFDVRFATGLAALGGGRAASRVLRQARYRVHHSGIRLHRR
jgi:hypothetical protein